MTIIGNPSIVMSQPTYVPDVTDRVMLKFSLQCCIVAVFATKLSLLLFSFASHRLGSRFSSSLALISDMMCSSGLLVNIHQCRWTTSVPPTCTGEFDATVSCCELQTQL